MINADGSLALEQNKYLLFIKKYYQEIIIGLVVLIFGIAAILALPFW